MKAFNMISLSAISTFSAAAMAVAPTIVRPTVQAPVVVPMVKPNAVGSQQQMALPGTTLESAQAQSAVVGETCDPRAMYAGLTAGTRFSPELAQELVQAKIVQISGTNCGKDAIDMSKDAREVLIGTGSCALSKGMTASMDRSAKVDILSDCQAGEKRGLGMTSATAETERANVESIAKTCGYYNLN